VLNGWHQIGRLKHTRKDSFEPCIIMLAITEVCLPQEAHEGRRLTVRDKPFSENSSFLLKFPMIASAG
jgi:hypothetical protein